MITSKFVGATARVLQRSEDWTATARTRMLKAHSQLRRFSATKSSIWQNKIGETGLRVQEETFVI